uniref:Uncharacterized protein n=1 Tax=Knipowitschia caucasica TaxID=637954 RepID=A0AAV2J8Y0_KNICA
MPFHPKRRSHPLRGNRPYSVISRTLDLDFLKSISNSYPLPDGQLHHARGSSSRPSDQSSSIAVRWHSDLRSSVAHEVPPGSRMKALGSFSS